MAVLVVAVAATDPSLCASGRFDPLTLHAATHPTGCGSRRLFLACSSGPGRVVLKNINFDKYESQCAKLHINGAVHFLDWGEYLDAFVKPCEPQNQ